MHRRLLCRMLALALVTLVLAPTLLSAEVTAPLRGRLVEAYTGEPIPNADVYVFEGRQLCFDVPVRNADGECTETSEICGGTIADLDMELAKIGLQHRLDGHAFCPEPSLKEMVTGHLVSLGTDQEGYFSSTAAYDNGDYTVLFLADGYRPTDVLVEHPTRILPSHVAHPEGRCQIHGQVSYEDGSPVAGGTVQVRATDFRERFDRRWKEGLENGVPDVVQRMMRGYAYRTSTDDTGRYCIPVLRAGTYDVSVSPPRGTVEEYWTLVRHLRENGNDQIRVSAPDGTRPPATVRADIELPDPPGDTRVTGRVVDRLTGDPVPAVVEVRPLTEVAITGEPERILSRGGSTYTDVDGQFELRGVPRGRSHVTIRPMSFLVGLQHDPTDEIPSYLTAERQLDVDVMEQTVRMPTIRLRRAEGSPPEIARVLTEAARVSEQSTTTQEPIAPSDHEELPLDGGGLTTLPWSCDTIEELVSSSQDDEPHVQWKHTCGDARVEQGPPSSPYKSAGAPVWNGILDVQRARDLFDPQSAQDVQTFADRMGQKLASTALQGTVGFAIDVIVEEVLPYELGHFANWGISVTGNVIEEGFANTFMKIFQRQEDNDWGQWQILIGDFSQSQWIPWNASVCTTSDSWHVANPCGNLQPVDCDWQWVPSFLWYRPTKPDTWPGHMIVLAKLSLQMERLGPIDSVDAAFCGGHQRWWPHTSRPASMNSDARFEYLEAMKDLGSYPVWEVKKRHAVFWYPPKGPKTGETETCSDGNQCP